MNENQNIFKHSEEQKLGCLYSREFQGALFPVRLPLALVDFFLGGGVVVGGATSSSGMAGGSPGVMGREGAGRLGAAIVGSSSMGTEVGGGGELVVG